MHIGIAGPVSLDILGRWLNRDDMPDTFSFPPLSHYACACLSAGHEVHIFTLGDVTATWTAAEGLLTVTVAPMRQRGRMRDFFSKERRALTLAMSASNCEIIHANWTYEFALAAQASGKPYVITARDAPFAILRYMRPLPYWIGHAIMSIPAIHRAPELVAAGPYLERYFRRFHLYRKPIYLISSFVSESSFAFYQDTPIPKSQVVFVSVNSGWGARKNVSSLLRAFQCVRASLPEAKLVLFGSGYGESELGAHWAMDNGLSNGVEFAGATPNRTLLGRLNAEASVLVHPSREESFGVAVADAMAMGIPVIAGERSGSIPWLLDFGKCGVLVDVNKPQAIANAMVELAGNPDECTRLRNAARQRAMNTFRLDAVRDQYIGLYKKIIARKAVCAVNDLKS